MLFITTCFSRDLIQAEARSREHILVNYHRLNVGSSNLANSLIYLTHPLFLWNMSLVKNTSWCQMRYH